MASRHRFLIDGREHTVSFEESDGRRLATVDDAAPVHVDVTAAGLPGLVSMLIDGSPVEAYVSRDGAGFDVTIGSRRFAVGPATGGSRGRRPVGGLEDPAGMVTAPLAGIVVEVRVAVGESFTTGQSLVVVEAMKMQNEVQAPRDGTVTVLHCTEGERVERGDLLLEYDSLD